MNIYIICGYGIPEDINKSQNYLTYLHIAFNKIFESSADSEAAIIPCGGPTNCTPPFKGTEAEMMGDYLKLMLEREAIKGQTEGWRIYLEDESLSTLENFVNAKKVIDENQLAGSITIFCEKTREKRVQELVKVIFEGQDVTVRAVDFDTTQNRYLAPEIIDKKEALALKEALWTLEDPERLVGHHEIFMKKLEFLRKRQTEGLTHEEAVSEWLKLAPSKLKEIMPDHPLING